MRKMEGDLFPVILSGNLANIQLPDPDLLQYFRDDARRIYWLEDEITPMDNAFIKRLIDWNQDDVGIPKDERKPVFLMINTPGGNLYTMFALIDAIQASETPVIGVVPGMAYSAGALILLACDRRLGTKHSSYMVHRGSGAIDAPDQRAAEMAMKQWSEQVKTFSKFIVERTAMTASEAKKALSTDTYYTADEALKKGILTGIISSLDELVEDMSDIS